MRAARVMPLAMQKELLRQDWLFIQPGTTHPLLFHHDSRIKSFGSESIIQNL